MATALRIMTPLLFASFGSIFAAGASDAQQSKMPPGSYLRKPSATGAELARQVASDPVVAKRYARVYRMDSRTVGQALKDLRPTRLREDRVLRVYYVHKGEKLGYKVRRLPKGTAVFAMADGTPAMVRACGNPLHADLSAGPTTAMLSPRWIRRYDVNEPIEAPISISESALTAWPATDAEGRVLAEVSGMAGPPAAIATESPEASGLVPESMPPAFETAPPPALASAYFSDWYRSPSGSVPTGYVPPQGTNGGVPPGGSIPFAPSPDLPLGNNDIGLASVPEPGPVVLLGALLCVAAGVTLRRRRAFRAS